MSDRHSLRLAIVPDPSRASFSGSDYWLRLEQITGRDIAEPAEMAEIIDELYGLEACSPEPTPEEEKPPITWERLLEIAKRRLDIEECRRRASGDYTARVKVIYSHPGDPSHRPKLSVTVGTIVSQQIVNEEISLTLSVREQKSLTLDYPVLQEEGEEWPGTAKWLGSVFNEESGPIPPPKITGSGNVLSWSTIATGTILVKFATTYELATISVPGVPRLGSLKGDTQATLLRAFWRLQVYELQVEAAAQDTTADGTTLAQLCGWSSLSGGSSGGSDSESDGESEDDDELEDDEGPELGCLEENPRLADPEYYFRACCKPPKFTPYTCLLFAQLREGVPPPDPDPDDTAEYVAVGPGPDGCGLLYTHLQVNRRNCCVDVTPMEPSPTNPSTMSSNTSIELNVLYGRQWTDDLDLWDWSVGGGLRFAGGGTTAKGGRTMYVVSPEKWCSTATVRVTDDCTTLTMVIGNTEPPLPLSIQKPPGGHVVAPSGYVSFMAQGGVEPYSWEGSGELALISGIHDSPATFQASPTFCGSATVFVADGCLDSADADVRSTDGEWEEIFDFDHCRPPEAGNYPAPDYYFTDYVSVSGKYRAQFGRGADGFNDSATCSPEDFPPTSPFRDCSVGNQISTTFHEFARSDCEDDRGTGSGDFVYDNSGCCQWTIPEVYPDFAASAVYSEYASDLWHWVCAT